MLSVLVDTTIWSLGLRRRPRDLNPNELRLVDEWRRLVEDGRVTLIGPIRQEILSGIRQERDFERVRERLADFDDVPILRVDYEQAAQFFNSCRAKGVTGGGVDLLICSVGQRLGLPIFTTDPDFKSYSRHLPVTVHEPQP
ncbi:MAG: PIN domain nuclease [Acidobacteria bacterium]|nr:MAG: PIN domain nuclease [Acidobacteriota bacterium]